MGGGSEGRWEEGGHVRDEVAYVDAPARPLILHKVYVRCDVMLCLGRSAAQHSGASSLLTRLSSAMR